MKFLCYSHLAGNPYWNMAVDEWLLDRAGQLRDTIFLRLYSWNQEAVTFGFHQHETKAVDQSKTNGVPVIRRITGGRAVLHQPSELTYSISSPLFENGDSPFGKSIAESSYLIASGISSSLASIGISTELVRSTSDKSVIGGNFHTLPCFESTSRYELLANGRKVVASAQRRLSNSFLQHGSIKFSGSSSHPSLNLSSGIESNGGQPLKRSICDSFGLRFASYLEQKLGEKSQKATLSNYERDMLDVRANIICQNPLEKRTILYTELQSK